MVWVYCGIVICLVLGLILFIVGWRGRRIDDHPHCRRCRYDLSGHDEVAVCPECGRSLARPRAIRQGLRRKRRVALTLGCLLLLLAGAGGGGLAWQRSTGYDWDLYKPVWWLHADAKRLGNPAVSEPALQELLRRLGRCELTSGQTRSLVDTALQLQQDERVAWPNSWGTFVQIGLSLNLIERDQAEAYWRTAATMNSLELETRPRIRQGARVPVELRLVQERVAGIEALAAVGYSPHRRVEPIRTRIDGEVLDEVDLHTMRAHMMARPVSAWHYGQLSYDGEIGSHLLEIDLECYVAPQGPGGSDYLALEDDEGDFWFGPWPATVTTEFEIIDASETIVERLPANQAGPAPVAHVRNKKGKFVHDAGGSNYVSFPKFGVVWLEEYGLGLSFDVIGIGADHEELLGGFASLPNDPASLKFAQPLAEAFPGEETIDLHLRTNLRHAEERIDIDAVWDGEIVLKNVSTALLEADPSPAEAARRGAPPKAHVKTDMGNFDVRAGNGFWSEFSMHGAVWLGDYPRPVSFDVIGRVGDREEIVGRIVAAGSTPMVCKFEQPLTAVFPEAETVDLILRSNIKHGVAEGLPSELLWTGEVVISHVRIRESEPAAATPGGEDG